MASLTKTLQCSSDKGPGVAVAAEAFRKRRRQRVGDLSKALSTVDLIEQEAFQRCARRQGGDVGWRRPLQIRLPDACEKAGLPLLKAAGSPPQHLAA